jgi:two-component system chemotaxis sensor kinase CheA
MADPSKDFQQRLRATFRAEAKDHLQDIVTTIVLLEQGGAETSQELVGRLLKRLHTLKGASRAIGLGQLEALCHAMESVFSALRGLPAGLSAEQFDTLHQAGRLAESLTGEPSGRIRNQAADLVRHLERLAQETHAAREAALPAGAPEPGAASAAAMAETAAEAPLPDAGVIRIQAGGLDAIRRQAESLLPVELTLQQHIADLLQLANDLGAAADGQAVRRFEQRCRRLAGALGQTRGYFAKTRSRLMEATLEAALVPVSSALEPLPGLVRNLARSQGKEAVLTIQGQGIQIDRRILEIVREALLHLVTNAVDHGIEPVAQRQAAGKPAAGRILVRIAQSAGNRVSIQVCDDGAGIDMAGLERAAGHANPDADDARNLNERQKLYLALRSGISTKPRVTSVSGRGVGLAIVAEKAAVTGGDLLIENRAGAGCSFELLLPMRLSTLRGLVIRAGGFSYVLPLAGVESVRALKDGDMGTVKNRETLTLGERIMPAIRLRRVLGLDRSREAGAGQESIALIARAGGADVALLVDEIVAEQEVLPKGLGRQLRRIRYITGATQLGDGSLVPILGLEDIAIHGLAAGHAPLAAERAAGTASGPRRILVAEDSITSRLLLKHILESAGYQVQTATDGVDALSRLRREDFDALISDIEMPRLDGIGLTQEVRAYPKTEDLPVVLVTSLQSDAERERGLRAGADAYVIKGSFDQDNLLATVRRLL